MVSLEVASHLDLGQLVKLEEGEQHLAVVVGLLHSSDGTDHLPSKMSQKITQSVG